MTLLLTYWKQLAGVALILIIFLFGWYKGSEAKQLEFDLFKQAVAREAAIANAIALEQEKRQENISKNITKGYADAVKKLKAHYVGVSHNTPIRVQYVTTSGSEVSNVSESTSGTTTNTESNLLVTNGDTLIKDCSEDVLTLLFLQKWVQEQSH